MFKLLGVSQKQPPEVLYKKDFAKNFLKNTCEFYKIFKSIFLTDQTSHENKAKTSCMQWCIDTRILELMKLINPF